MPNQATEPATICPVILSGGVGSRLWPLSSKERPKQFQRLMSDRSMMQETLLRVGDPELFSSPVVVSGRDLAAVTAEHAAEIGMAAHFIFEPLGRGTAPAVALAALDLAERGRGDEVMLVLPADHLIQDISAFRNAIITAAELARAGKLVTLGIQPSAPVTGYGYIRRGEPIGERVGAHLIDAFKEKPDLESARGYLLSGEYAWNAGIFVFRAADMLDEMADFCPDILRACRAALAAATELETGVLADEAQFRACPSGSLDVLVMERTRRGAVVSVSMGWSDVGSWNALWEVGDKDAAGNVLLGDVIALDASGCYGRTDSGSTLALVGLTDLVVVSSGTSILVAHRDSAERVKAVYEMLQSRETPLQG